MKKKITLNELRTIINQRVMKLVENHLNDIKSLEDRLYYFMGADGEIDHNDLLDVASETGLNPDDETFIMALAGARARKKQEKNDELKSDIQYVIASEFGGDAPASFGDFYAVFDGQHFDQQYDKADVFKLYKSMTTDPNQLALFEAIKKRLLENNIYLNKHGIETVREPIIPDVVKILSKNPEAIQVNNKKEFKTLLDKQRYFSSSYSHCFYSIEEYNIWSKTHTKSPEAESSIMLFETGREPVGIWDEKNQIGYIIPKNR